MVRGLRRARRLDRLRPRPQELSIVSRRAFLLAGFALPLAGCAASRSRLAAYPFTLGIASGYPRAGGVVLWTRLAPRPANGGGMDPESVQVRWEMAEDEAFKRIVRRGAAVASPARAHAVHVEVDGLQPARDYHYRFLAGGYESAAGRTRTAPQPGHGDDRLRLALACCQQYEQGFYVAHRHLAAEHADLVAFVGDYIYESSWGRNFVRSHGAPEPRTLDEYRSRYALYKSDPDLQACHASAPWVVTWDDHEVDNDYASDRSEDLDPDFLARRAAAYRAFAEHMPLPRSMLRAGGGVRIHDRLDWGGLAKLHILDGRQYRSHQACPRQNRGGSNVVGGECAARLDPARTLLGEAQERWLDEGLATSRARWNLLVQQTLFAPSVRQTDRGPMHWTDGWEGYPAARERLLGSLAGRGASNPVVLGGDVHAAMAANLHAGGRAENAVIATEFVATSISSQGPSAYAMQMMRAANPHIRYANGDARGYAMLEIGRDRLEARVRAVETVKRNDSPVATLAAFTVESGRPGLS